jgi:hypothetical protein
MRWWPVQPVSATAEIVGDVEIGEVGGQAGIKGGITS